MLTSIFRALCEHMAPLGLPVYLAQCVPSDAAFPYITAKISVPLSTHATGAVTLTLYAPGDQPHSRFVSLADELLTLLPAHGFHLDTDACALALRQEGGAMCVREGAALGVRGVWKLRCFPARKEASHAASL